MPLEPDGSQHFGKRGMLRSIFRTLSLPFTPSMANFLNPSALTTALNTGGTNLNNSVKKGAFALSQLCHILLNKMEWLSELTKPSLIDAVLSSML